MNNAHLEKQAKLQLEKRIDEFKPEDINDVLKNEEKMKRRAKGIRSLRHLTDTISSFFGMIRDYATGQYKNVPIRTIAAIVGALAYFASPIDAIPDFIPFLGFTDDAAVFAFCLKLVGDDVEEYRKWKDSK